MLVRKRLWRRRYKWTLWISNTKISYSLTVYFEVLGHAHQSHKFVKLYTRVISTNAGPRTERVVHIRIIRFREVIGTVESPLASWQYAFCK